MARLINKTTAPYFISITILILMGFIYTRYSVIEKFVANSQKIQIDEFINSKLHGEYTLFDEDHNKKGEMHIFSLDHPSPNIKSKLMGYTVKIINQRAHKNAQGFFVISKWENDECLVEWYTIEHTFSPLSRTFDVAKRKQGGELIFSSQNNTIQGSSQTAIPIYHKHANDSLEIKLLNNGKQVVINELISDEMFFLERNR